MAAIDDKHQLIIRGTTVIHHTSPATFKATLRPMTAPCNVKPHRLTVPSAPEDIKPLTGTGEWDNSGDNYAGGNTQQQNDRSDENSMMLILSRVINKKYLPPSPNLKLCDPLTPMRTRHQHFAAAAVDQVATPSRRNDHLPRKNSIDTSTNKHA